jgi:hypothetical protein
MPVKRSEGTAGIEQCSYLFPLWDRIQGEADLLSSVRMSRALSGMSIFTVCFNETEYRGPRGDYSFPHWHSSA